MKQVKKSVLLWYSAQEMYELVTAVPDYPKFLPWCERGEIVEQHDNGVTARLHLAFKGLKHTFTTRNTLEPNHKVTLQLVDGPFSSLYGDWMFIPLDTQPSQRAEGNASTSSSTQAPVAPARVACRINFELNYAFSNRALELMVSPVFDKIANTLVDSFVKRAEQVYGKR